MQEAGPYLLLKLHYHWERHSQRCRFSPKFDCASARLAVITAVDDWLARQNQPRRLQSRATCERAEVRAYADPQSRSVLCHLCWCERLGHHASREATLRKCSYLTVMRSRIGSSGPRWAASKHPGLVTLNWSVSHFVREYWWSSFLH